MKRGWVKPLSWKEGLAHRIVDGDVPENLRDKDIYSPGYGRPDRRRQVPGNSKKQRLKSVIKEVTAAEGRIFLFIDEIPSSGRGKPRGNGRGEHP